MAYGCVFHMQHAKFDDEEETRAVKVNAAADFI
jgi:hypothetical protein